VSEPNTVAPEVLEGAQQSNWPGTREVLGSPEDLVRAVAERLVQASERAIEERGVFSLVLSGGSTPKALYQLLASDEFKKRLDWPNIVILFGDERAVEPDDVRSNYRMAREALLDSVPLKATNVHRMRGELPNLNQAAKEYGLLVQELGTTLDVCLMGMGPDGHTASLFPHSPQLSERKHRCTATPIASQEPHVERLTLTYRAFDVARHVWILLEGQSKAERLKQVLAGPREPFEQPIQGLNPTGELVWFLDKAAAREL